MSQKAEWSSDPNPVKMSCEKLYMTRTGSRQSQPNKCVAVARIPEGFASIVQHSYRTGYTALLTNQYLNDYSRPESYPEEKVLLHPLLTDISLLIEEFKVKMNRNGHVWPNNTRRSAIVMVANEGVMDLLLNFICSAEGVGIDLGTVMVFVGAPSYVPLLEDMGVNAMYHSSLGEMPRSAAKMYMDSAFARMMWLKTTSVYVAMAAGYDVLFQDVDLVWLRDPLPYLDALGVDVAFMDDGARTPRYTPFFVNSGFFYIRHNHKTRYFQERLMKASVSEIGYSHSHQSVMIRHLAETVHLANLRIHVLSTKDFPSGQAYHEDKKYIKKIIDRSHRPFVFHMCWTSNKVDKLRYFKEIGLWFLSPAASCGEGPNMMAKLRDKGICSRCCQRNQYWPPLPKPSDTPL